MIQRKRDASDGMSGSSRKKRSPFLRDVLENHRLEMEDGVMVGRSEAVGSG